MARVELSRPRFERRSIAYALGSALVVLLLVAGFAFVDSMRVARVADNARSLHWANATLGTSALTRAGLVQAVTFAELEQGGLVTSDDFDFAMEQLSAASGELGRLFTMGEAHDSYSALARFVAPVQVAIEELAGDEVASAKQRLTTDVESAYVDLVDTLEAEQARIQAAIDDNSADNRELNGWILFFVTLAVPGSAVAVYFVVARRQMRAMQEWNRLEIDAERAIGRAKDSFIAGLSHELRTPLTSIYGFAEMMTDGEIKGPEAVEEAALTIATEAAEMARMVDDLLVASRLASTGVELEIVPTNVVQVVDAALTPFIRAGVAVSWEPTTAYVVTDGARLRHVLVNLLSNAVRHGGQSVGVEVTEGDGVIEVEVWDDGPGVPDEHVDRLFDPYVHRDDAALLTGSVGLGLAVASRLAALLGGRLAYQRFGGKTYFVLTLPVSAETVLADTDEPESVASVIRALASS